MKKTWLGSVICGAIALGAITGQGQSYNITDLGASLGTNSYAYGINNQGQVVGYWSSSNGARAFLYNAGLVTDLGSLGGTNQYALSINSSGQIVGYGAATNGIRAFLYSGGALTNLGALGGLNSYAYGINDGGQIVGFIDATNGARAFIYNGGAVTNIGTLGGSNSYAFGLNNSNSVVGSSSTATSSAHAFIWKNGGLTNLNALISTNAGWVLNDARGINNVGNIVGWGVTNGIEQAFLYNSGVITKIGVLPGATNSYAFGVNNSNQVVGASTLSNSLSRAFVWLNGALTDLNSLLPPGSEWDLREARGINDNGQIVGWGVIHGAEHAFVLAPNATPFVTLSNPLSNAVFAAPASIPLQASATDADGTVAKVEFFQSNVKLGEVATSPYALNWTGVQPGNYLLSASVTDNSGLTNVSSQVTVTVAVPPSITISPQSQRIVTSSNVTFTVTAAGSAPLSYQWYFKGLPVAGATSSSYSITNVQTAHGGTYLAIVTNIVGNISSSPAVLTVTADPKNLGKGDWIYFLSDATNHLGQNVAAVTDIVSLFHYERQQGMQFIVVKAGDGATPWSQFDSNLVAQAHLAGLKIFPYGRVYGIDIPGELAVATNALALGADGFVIDAEIEYESQNLTNNSAAAAQYCQGIRAAFPNTFLAYSTFVYLSSHTTFPYVAFGTNCDAVMPQCYWKSFGITPVTMANDLNTEWRNWQNSLSGASANAIKPIAPVGQAWSPSTTNITTGAEIADFMNRLKTISNPASSGGYRGVSFWRADLHTPDMWDRIGTTTFGNANGGPLITTQPSSQTVTNGANITLTVVASGTAPLTYQWRLNGIAISGATTTSLALSNVQSASAGVYSVIVSNASGVTLSSDATVTLAGYALWTETFESGLGSWSIVNNATALTNSATQNHTTGGTNSARVSNTGNKMYRNLGAEIDGNTKITFWIYDGGQNRFYGEVRAYAINGFNNTTGLQQLFAIGRFNSGFTGNTGSLSAETVDSTKYQGRVFAGANSGWFNLNAIGTPGRSSGWHKFEIERQADNSTINFYVDGVLARTITSATAATWDSVTVGSLGSGTTTGDAWFDDVKPEIIGTPYISTQPLSQTTFAGTSVTFSVVASGNISGYQWRFNGVNISGATGSSLTLNNVQGANAGDYTVVIQNPLGSTVSSPASLTVLYPPTISSGPTNQTAPAGGTVNFSVNVSGSGPFTYQWKKNGLSLTNSARISGATTAQLTITNLNTLDEAAYSVAVSNPAGSVSSASALLTVTTSVVFADNFENGLTNWVVFPGATSLALSSGQPNPVSGTKTAYETNSLNKMYHNLGVEVGGRSRATFWIYDDNTAFPTTRSFGEVRSYSGSGYSAAGLQQVLAVGNYTVPFDAHTGTLSDETVATSLYQGRVYGGLNSGWFNLNVPGVPSRTAGWHKFAIEQSADGKTTHFFVDGKLGRTINDVTGASWDVVTIGSAGIGSGVEQAAWLDDVKVEMLTSVITAQPASCTKVVGASATFAVSATGTELQYQWRKDGVTISGATLSSYSITNVQTSDQGLYSVCVTSATDREYSALAQLTAISAPIITGQPVSQSVGVGSNAVFSVSASGLDLSYLWRKNGANLSEGANLSGTTGESLMIIASAHDDEGNYSVIVSNAAGSVESSTANLVVLDAPSIVAQPVSQVVGAGSNVVFSVIVGGSQPVTYQWKMNGSTVLDGGKISGALTPNLTLAGVSSFDAGGYSLVASNLAGEITSSNATLTVVFKPVVTTQPVSQTICASTPVSFTVGATGVGLSPQWKKNGINLTDTSGISGTKTSTLIISNATAVDAAEYTVSITNIAGMVSSMPATLSVIPPVIVDLDIDSTNGVEFELPARSFSEEVLENEGSLPGKYISVNDGDVDADGVPNFADGIDKFGNSSNDAGGRFVPLMLQVSPSDSSDARIVFHYSASDPALVSSVTNGGDGFIYTSAPGHLRIWRKDGSSERKVTHINAGGDYVATEEAYTLSDLGLSRLKPIVVLYVEGIAPSSIAGDSITVEVRATTSPQTCTQTDTVRLTIDFDSDRDGLVDRWEHALGTEDNMMDTDHDGRTDLEEHWEGTDPVFASSVKHERLERWSFRKENGSAFFNTCDTEEGSTPTHVSGVEYGFAASWENPAISLRLQEDTLPEDVGLSYKLFRTPSRPILTPLRGTISFWFQPNWESGDVSGLGESQNSHVLLSLGRKGSTEADGLEEPRWEVETGRDGTNLCFSTTDTNGVKISSASGLINWNQGTNHFFTNAWHHIAVTYSVTNITIYVDGVTTASTNSTQLALWTGTLSPSEEWRLWIGGSIQGNKANGSFDSIETYNYTMSQEEVLAKYFAIANLDSDRDGLADLDELRRSLNPRNADSDGDGMPDGWELRFGLNPLNAQDASENPDHDGRNNQQEFWFGSDPYFQDQEEPMGFDVVGNASDKSVLINVDFGQAKSIQQVGPAAAGIDTNDQWIAWPLFGFKNPLTDGAGNPTSVSLFCSYSPIYSYYTSNDADPSSGNFCEPLHVLNCHCDNLCQEIVASSSSSAPLMSLSSGDEISEDNSDVVDPEWPLVWPWPPTDQEPERPKPGPGPWPPRCPPSFVDCNFTNICAVLYKYDHAVRQPATASDANAPYAPIPEFLNTRWSFDLSGSTAEGAPPMFSDSAHSFLDSYQSSDPISPEGVNSSYLNFSDARAVLRIAGLKARSSYRVYLYAAPDSENDDVAITVSNNSRDGMTPGFGGREIRLGTGDFNGYIDGFNYTRFVIRPSRDEVDFTWKNKNSSLRGMQLVELRPLIPPTASVNALLVGGRMVRWTTVPQTLQYNIFRKGPHDTTFKKVASTKEPFYHDLSVQLPFLETNQYSYFIEATNELYTAKSAPVSVSVPWNPNSSENGEAPLPDVSGNHPPMLNYVKPLVQAYERSPFLINASKIQEAASVFDPEGASLDFAITRIVCGKLEWVESVNGEEHVSMLTNADIQSEMNSTGRLRLIRPGIKVRWIPPDGAHEDTVALRVRAFDGICCSTNAADVIVNVKPQTMLLWWGSYCYGLSGGGIPSTIPLQDGFSVWGLRAGSTDSVGPFTSLTHPYLSYDQNEYTRLPAPVLVSQSTLDEIASGERLSVVDGTLRNVVAIAGEGAAAKLSGIRLALTADGNLWSWGNGTFGQFFDGSDMSPDSENQKMLPWFTTRERPFATRVPGMSNIVSVATDGYYSLVAKEDGTVWGWGPSRTGFKSGNEMKDTLIYGAASLGSSPFATEKLYSAVSYDLPAWDSGVAGRIDSPYGVFGAVAKPVQVTGLENIVQVAASTFFSAALSADGRAFFWGLWDLSMNLDAKQARYAPVDIRIPGKVVQIAAGEWSLIALTESGDVYYYDITTLEPVKITGLTDIKKIAACYYNHLALTESGKVLQWGAMGAGRNRPGTFWPYYAYDPPSEVPGLTNIVSISAGFESAFAVDSKGRLWGWGVEAYGLFGHPFESEPTGWFSNVNRKPSNTILVPQIINFVQGVGAAATFDMNGYASAAVKDVPQNVVGKPADESAILSWDRFSSAQHYEVKRSLTEVDGYYSVATVPAKPDWERQHFTDTGLQNGQPYFYRVSVRINGFERESDPIRVVPQPVPAKPTNFTATAKSRQIHLEWSAKNNADSYRIWRSSGFTAGEFKPLVTVANQILVQDRLMFIDDLSLPPNQTNWYKLQAINLAGASDYSDVVTAVATSGGPSAPEGLSATPANTSVSLVWQAPTGTAGNVSYVIWISKAYCNSAMENNSNFPLKWEFAGTTSATSFEIEKLVKNRCYAFAVSTVDNTGEGERSMPVTARTGADGQLPDLVILEKAAGPGSLYLKWQCPVELFHVSVKTASSGNLLCGGNLQLVFPDDNGTAEIWMTGLQPGSYDINIVRIGDDSADNDGFVESVEVENVAPWVGLGYPLRPLLAVAADKRVELSWWGESEGDAKSALDAYQDWKFILLRQETGITTAGFPCANFEPIGEGKGFRFSDTNVVNGHHYSYRIVGITPENAVYERGLGEGSDDITPKSFFASDASIGLAAVALNSAVQLTWTSNSWSFPDANKSKVELFRSLGIGEPLRFIANITASHVYLDRDVENGHTYHYFVRATHQNGDLLEATATASPDVDKPLLAPADFKGTVGPGKLVATWNSVAGATAYRVQKWNVSTSQYEPLTSVGTPQFIDALGNSTSVYRYKIAATAGGKDGLASEFRVQPLTWTWPPSPPPTPLPAVSGFEVQRQCPGGLWKTIGTTSYLQWVDVRTECIESTAGYRAVPIIDNVADPALSQTPSQIQTGDLALNGPPACVNTFIDGTNADEHGEIIIRLLGFDSATNAMQAVGLVTPTNVTLRASVSFAPLDQNVTLERVEFYAGGELLVAKGQLPFEYEWKNPAGTISGKLYQLTVRVVDSLGRSKDSPVFFANVTNLPPLKAFTTSANDVQVAAPGVPLSLSRSYNSLDLRPGLLGKGWKTDWDQARMIVPKLDEGWYSKRTIIASQPFNIQETNAHRVEVTLPGGTSQHFHLAPSYAADTTGGQIGMQGISIGGMQNNFDDDFTYRLPFVFAPEADAFGTLKEKQGSTVLQVGGRDFILDAYADTEREVTLSRTSEASFVPDSFIYTGADGSTYEFGQAYTVDAAQTQELSLLSVTDRNGNKVTYNQTSDAATKTRSFTGISHSNGRSLRWTEETVAAVRYIEVYDPAADAAGGPPVLRYVVQDDLLREVQHLKSRLGAVQYDTTKYEYFEGLSGTKEKINGMLRRIISPEGTILLENDYFGTAAEDPAAYLGFLKSQKDVVGGGVNLAHDTSGLNGEIESIVTKSVPGETATSESTAVFNSSGQPISVTDASSQTSLMGYDDQGRLTYTQNAAGDYKGFDYDEKDRPVAVTDELGNQTEIAYGAFDQPVNTTDAEGNESHYEYYHYTYGHTAEDPNPEGSLRLMTDAAGVTTEYTYNAHGQILTETRKAPGASAPITTIYEYYPTGDLKIVKEPLWQATNPHLYTTEYTYDANGNQATEMRYREVPARNGNGTVTGTELQTVTTTYTYDAQNRMLTSVMSLQEGSGSSTTLQTTTSHYNAAGKVDWSTDAYGRKTEMLYDVRGNLIETKSPDSAVTRTVFDGSGRPVWQQERCLPSGSSTSAPATFTQYDNAGRVIAIKRYADVTLTKTAATSVDEGGGVTDSAAQYRVKSGGSSQTQYYMATNTVAMNSFASISRTVYDALGRVRYSMDNRGVVTGYGYDAIGRRTNVVVYPSYVVSPLTANITPSGDHTTTSYGYDGNGNQVWVKDAAGNRTDFEYDVMNRRTITSFPAVDGDGTLRRTRKTVYDALGRRMKEIDEAGVITAFGYDLLGRLTSVTNDYHLDYPSTETPVVTRYGYDAFGNEIAQTDAAGRTTLFEYDALGRRTHRILPSGSTDDRSDNTFLERATYSRVETTGGVFVMRKQVKDFRGRSTTFDYDIMDRLVKTTPAANDSGNNPIPNAQRTTVEYTYTTSGQRAQVVQSVGTDRTVRYAYDALGRLRVKETPEGTLTYEYNSSGSLSKISARYSYTGWTQNAPSAFETLTGSAADTSRAEWNYQYDTLGRLRKVNADSSAETAPADATYTYTDVGNLNTTAYRNGLTTAYRYNQRNWLRNLETTNGSGARVAFFDYDASGWASENRLSPTGQRRCVQETFGETARTVTYSYDRLSRLTAEKIVTGSTGPAGTVRYDALPNAPTTTGYDLVGNRLARRVIDGNALITAGVTESSHTYDSHDLIFSGGYFYDPAGNTTIDPVGATYVYDAENRLIQRSGGVDSNSATLPEVKIVYDADGNRVAKSVVISGQTNTTQFLVDDRNLTGYAQVMEEWARTDSGAATLNRLYTYGLDLISQKQGSTVTYYGYDGLGSTRYLSDADQAIVDTYTYDGFGIQIASSGSTPNHYRYTGEQWDADLGMYYLRVRYYRPELGRFWTMDSFEGGQEDPMSLHKYLYACSSPVGFRDPSGHDLVGFLGSVYGMVQIAAFNLAANYGVYTEAVAVITTFQMLKSAQLLITGTDPDTGEQATALGAAFAVVDFLPNGKLITKPLKGELADVWRRAARDIWDGVSHIPRGTSQVHHRIPLEWAHLFPRLNPNRISNLKLVVRDIHYEVSAAWTEFRTFLAGRTPTAEEVLTKASEIDGRFGQHFQDL